MRCVFAVILLSVIAASDVACSPRAHSTRSGLAVDRTALDTVSGESDVVAVMIPSSMRACTLDDILTKLEPELAKRREWARKHDYNLPDVVDGCEDSESSRQVLFWYTAKYALSRAFSTPPRVVAVRSSRGALASWQRTVDFPIGSGSAREMHHVVLLFDGAVACCVFTGGVVLLSSLTGDVMGWEMGPWIAINRIDTRVIDGRWQFRMICDDGPSPWFEFVS